MEVKRLVTRKSALQIWSIIELEVTFLPYIWTNLFQQLHGLVDTKLTYKNHFHYLNVNGVHSVASMLIRVSL